MKLVKEHIKFERHQEPKRAMQIGKLPSRMCNDGFYESLYYDDEYSIEKYLNTHTNKYNIVVADSEGFCDWVVYYGPDQIGFDYPEKFPKRIRDLVRKFYNELRSVKESNFERNQKPSKSMNTGIHKYKDFTE